MRFKILLSNTVLLTVSLLLFSVVLMAQQPLSLPSFSYTTGVELANTNGNWIKVNSSQPNNIDLLETKMYKMPAKGSGIVALEFKLVGADGGTARFQDLITNNFAKGGKGAELNFRLDLEATATFGKPFLVTFGKKGESTTINRSVYCAAGGGGSTGMAWIVPGANSFDLCRNWRTGNPNYLIAAAGGGSGGMALFNRVVDGKSATTGNSTFGAPSSNSLYWAGNLFFDDRTGETLLGIVSGGSFLRYGASVFNPPYCCSNDLKANITSSAVHNVFDYYLGANLNTGQNGLHSITLGQGGGKPFVIIPGEDGTPYFTGFSSKTEYAIVKNGGRGGSGFAGGGAGTTTTNFYDGAIMNNTRISRLTTSGAGGTGSVTFPSLAHKNLQAGDAGFSGYSWNLNNVSLSQRTATSNPESGYFMYRTIADTEPPVVNSDSITLYIGNGRQYPFGSTTATLNTKIPSGAFSDNDSIKTISFSKNVFDCGDVGTTQWINVTVTDFAGNTTVGTFYVTVRDTATPVIVFEPPQNPFDPNSVDPNRIDVSSGSYTLTAANFPKGYDGCNGNNVITHFPPTTFDCSHAGIPQSVNFYFIGIDGDSSPVYTKSFNVVYNAATKLYVDQSATGANDGSSWANAFNSVQDAIKYGCTTSGREIYVARGIYHPDRGREETLGDRNASFEIPDGFKLYGGFPSGGDVFANRNPIANPVILSGAIGNSTINTDNSYHVVTIRSNNTLLDGFTIENGYADDSTNLGGGGLLLRQMTGALFSSHRTTISNCKFQKNVGNMGGAVHTHYKNVAYYNYLDFRNCSFENNTSLNSGGAVYLSNHNVIYNMRQTFVNCVFNKNTAVKGGGIFALPKSQIDVVNCSFANNKTTTSGGAISNQGSIMLHNTILYFDTAAGVQNEIDNAGTMAADFSNIHGSGGSQNWGLSGVSNSGNNLDIDPIFNNFPTLSILPQSKCRNGGSKQYNSEPYDIIGNVRVKQDTIDIGAYEVSPVVYVAWDAPAGGDGESWATAYNNFSDGLSASIGTYLKDVWVKSGTYRPDRATNGANKGRENTFSIPSSIKVYGGFAGTESSTEQRNIGLNPTILSGDIGTLNDASDNTYHVVTINSLDTRLDGFIVEGGNANHATNNTLNGGGGIYINGFYPGTLPVFANCVVRNNNCYRNGGGIYANYLSDYSLDIIQCVFYGNTAARGAAVYIQSANASNVVCNMYNSTAINNTSYAFNAGAFEANVVTQPGTAVINAYNSLWVNNLPQNYNDIGAPGSIHGVNTFVSNDTTNVVSVSNPLGADGLIMTADDGFKLRSASSAVNYGNNDSIYFGVKKDIAGEERILQNKVDAGAYESMGCLGLTKLYVDAEVDTLIGDGSSWTMAFKKLEDALAVVNICPSIDSVFIAKGTYHPGDVNEILSTDVSFDVWTSVKILGGYPNGGGARNVNTNAVVLSGDINSQAKTDNAVHIMRIGSGTADTTLVDGITFMNGYAAGTGTNISNGNFYRRTMGGAINSINSNLHINNCKFLGNYAAQGGAVSFSGGNFISTKSVYDGNTSVSGGAIYANGNKDTLSVVGNVFVRDSVTNGSGGAILSTLYSTLGYTQVVNNVFALNSSATGSGGALFISTGAFRVKNNTFYRNTANGNTWGAVNIQANPNSNNHFVNNLFWNNIGANGNNDYFVSDFNTVSNNSVEVNPAFTDSVNLLGTDELWFTADDGLKLKPTSIVINGGNTTLVETTKDIANAARVQLGAVDIGAYESNAMVSRWYVSQAQDSLPGDGTSWATAFTKFQDGVNAAKIGDTVWVAKGMYAPETVGASFGMKSGVKIFGGFGATESNLSQRNLSLGYNSILQGNGSGVMVNNNVDTLALLDGFVIAKGVAQSSGGGILNRNTNTRFRNVVFENNTATKGGALANFNSKPVITNAVFYLNKANTNGGAVYDSASTTTILQGTFYANQAQNGSVLAQYANSNFTMKNSVSWNNDAKEISSNISAANITYSLLQEPNNGNGNIVEIEPNFSNVNNPTGFDGLWFTLDDGLSASYKSAFVNNGSNVAAIGVAKDISDAARIQNGVVDMGAYETSLLNFCDSIAYNNNRTLYVNAATPASGNGFSWSTPLKTLNEALDIANYCSGIDSVLVATGTYYATAFQGNFDRNKTFKVLRGGLKILGGYSGDNVFARNPGYFNTVLSGDINEEQNAADNSFNILTFENAQSNTVLDGFVLTGGRADSTIKPFSVGGAIYNSANGAGRESNPTISNCVFTENTARNGGAVYTQGIDQGIANPKFVNCVFQYDTALQNGGAIYSNAANGGTSSPSVINCSFGRNHASGTSGALYLQNTASTSLCTILNSVLWQNTSVAGTANQKQLHGSSANSVVSYSVFEGGLPAIATDGGNNLYSNPMYSNLSSKFGNDKKWMTADDGLALFYGSPAAKSGTPVGAPSRDIANIVRGASPDRGAYQNQCTATLIYLNMQQVGCDSVVSPSRRFKWFTTGQYQDTVFSAVGCDTIYTVALTQGKVGITNDTITACGSYISPSGKYIWNTSGAYNDTLASIHGCDSIVSFELTINQLPTPTIVRSNDTLFTQSYNNYDWLLNGNSIGSNTREITFVANGDYAVVVTDSNGCVDTSGVLNIVGVAINEIPEIGKIEVYPNPSAGEFTIALNNNEQFIVSVNNGLGSIIKSEMVVSKTYKLNLSEYAGGFYFLHIKHKNEHKIVKLCLVK